MKKILLTTLLALTIATPAFAGSKVMQEVESTVVDSHGTPVVTKDNANVSSTVTPAAAATEAPEKAAAEPTKKAKATKKKVKKTKVKKTVKTEVKKEEKAAH